MARSKGVEELSAAPQRAAFLEAAVQAAEQRLSHQCTFRPDTSKPGVPPDYRVTAKAPFSVATEPSDTLTERCAPAAYSPMHSHSLHSDPNQ